ncbi:MAG: hypothetical protein JNK78_07480 [Planctomycetes bacterium]|nr:hypothetical protein [Planctomycetota bacterium]
MAKWGLFGAHRYLEPDAGPGRLVGPDGRNLRRPWRVVSAEAKATAMRVRAMRPRPLWPRLFGISMIAIAVAAALHPFGSVHPIARHVGGVSSAPPASWPLPAGPLSPDGCITAVPDRFSWSAPADRVPFAVVVCDASYAELLRVDGIAAAEWHPDAAVRERLAEAGTFHWFVEQRRGERVARTPFASCEVALVANPR